MEYCCFAAESSFLLCDTLVGSLEHIVANNRLFQLLARLRLLSYLVRKREQSYEVITQVDTDFFTSCYFSRFS